MNKNLIFIQGAGQGAYQEDKKLVKYLQDSIGFQYNILYPKMPNEQNPEYEEWKSQISKKLNNLDGEVVLVGHSVGGSVLLKYISEENITKNITGLFLIAPPYDKSILNKDSSLKLQEIPRIFFYHNRDDKIVPFSHLTNYIEKHPNTIARKFEKGGHQFNNDLSEVVKDINSF